MKIYAAVLASLISTGAIAATDSQKNSCAVIADLNAAIAQDRDSGEPMYKLQNQAKASKSLDLQSRNSLSNIIQSIYNQKPYRDMTPRELRNWSYDTCLERWL